MKNCCWTSRVVYFKAFVFLYVLRKILVQTSSVFSSLILILVNRRFLQRETFLKLGLMIARKELPTSQMQLKINYEIFKIN